MFIKEGCLNNLKGAFMNFKRGNMINKSSLFVIVTKFFWTQAFRPDILTCIAVSNYPSFRYKTVDYFFNDKINNF